MTTKNNVLIGVAAVIVVAIAAVFLTGGTTSLGVLGGTTPNGVPILLTDPPYVPSGTTALDVNYSSVAVFYTNGTQSGWVNAQGSGTVDLLSLVNVTELVANASVPNGSVISKAKFNVSSATITLNGTTYPVVTPNPQIIANVSYTGTSQKVNSSTSVVVDLSPTVVTVFTNNQTLFIMVPSVKAIVVGNESVRIGLHGKFPIPTPILHRFGPPPNITITGASLSVTGNTTQLSVTVINNANRTVELNNVLLYGNESTIVPNSPCPFKCPPGPYAMCPACILPGGQVNSTTNVSIQGNVGIVGAIGTRVLSWINGRHSFDPVRSYMDSDANASAEAAFQANATIAIGFWQHFRVVDFAIASNGTLIQPYYRCYYPVPINVGILPGGYIGGNVGAAATLPGAYANGAVQAVGGSSGPMIPVPPITCMGGGFSGPAEGVSLQPGQSETLQFNSQITLGYGLVDLAPIIGQIYNIRVLGSQNAHTETNVTAA